MLIRAASTCSGSEICRLGNKALPALDQKPFLRRTLIFTTLFCAGGISSLAMAPVYFWPGLILGLSGLYIYFVYETSLLRQFIAGWIFGFGYFLFGLSWIGNALLVDGNPYLWAWPLAVAGLPAFLALFYGCATTLASLCKHKQPWAALPAFIAALYITEWLRGHILTGFPWNLFGYTWLGASPEIAQTAVLGDVYFLTLLTLFWFTVPGFALSNFLMARHKAASFAVISAALLTLAAAYAFGHARLLTPMPKAQNDLQIKIVQANINQAEKWDRRKMLDHFETHIALSQNRGHDETTSPSLIIWPETSITQAVLDSSYLMDTITDMLAGYPPGTRLITGALLQDSNGSYRNAMVEIDMDGDIRNVYHKHHLVPFGEYIPLQKWIPLETVTGFTGFKAGTGPITKISTEETFNLKYSPTICYEAIFPNALVEKNTITDVIINVTNDAWYGITAGPHQHLDKARMRAIETGVPVLRAAGTGISAVIDPHGRLVSVRPLGKQGTVETDLPGRLVVNMLVALRSWHFVIFGIGFLLCALIRKGKNKSSD